MADAKENPMSQEKQPEENAAEDATEDEKKETTIETVAATETVQSVEPVPLAQTAGDSREVRNSSNCQASCNKENLAKKAARSFADKNTEGPPGPGVNGINPIQDNLSLVLHAVKDLKLEVRPMPEPKPNQVLLQMEVVGICGSDVHYYVDGKIGHFVVNSPMVMGHEASGTVLKCGEKVKSLKPGDRVAIEPHIPCRECEYCKSGKYNLCINLFFCATPPDDGNLSRYYVHDADFCYKLPDNMDFEHGTLMEPLAVGVHACTKLGVTCGDYLLIMGAGPIGLVTLLAGRAFGASKILITEIDETKVKKALEMGASFAINISGMSDDDVVKAIHEKFGRAPNKTVDCCGMELAIRAGIKATKSGGKFAAVGMGKDEYLIPYADFLIREVDLIGSFRYVNNYPTAIDMVASGKIDPKPLITHHFKMENSIKAFDMAANQEEPFIKIMIHTNPFWEPGFLTKHPSQMATPKQPVGGEEVVDGDKSAGPVSAETAQAEPDGIGKPESGSPTDILEQTLEKAVAVEEATPEPSKEEHPAEEPTAEEQAAVEAEA